MDTLLPSGVFLMFSMFSFLACVLEYFFVAETQNLSERERKELYIPGADYGRKLKRNEMVTVMQSPVMS
jgi:hypothetical protein